jgi:hypothetical protein
MYRELGSHVQEGIGMKSSCQLLVLAALVFFNVIAVIHAQVKLHACNTSSVPIRIAEVNSTPCLLSCDDYKVYGWTEVSPNDCQALVERSDDLYLAVYVEAEGGFFVTPGVRANGMGLFSSDNNDRIQYFHPANVTECVRRQASYFSYTTNDLHASSCAEEGMLATFSILFRATGWMENNQDEVKVYLNVDGALGSRHASPQPNNSAQNVANTTAADAKDVADAAAQEQRWVQEDVNDYIAASKTNFEGFKKGNPIVKDGKKTWASSSKPLAANFCEVIQQQQKSNLFMCVLSHDENRQSAENHYQQLIDEVKRATPGWIWIDKPYPQEVDSALLKSASLGLEGEIYVHYDPASKQYYIAYQLFRY